VKHYPEEKTETLSSEDFVYTLTDTECGYRDLDAEAREYTEGIELLLVWTAVVFVSVGLVLSAAVILGFLITHFAGSGGALNELIK